MLAGLACLSAAGTEAADLGEGVATAVSRTVAELAHGELLDVGRGFDTGLSLPDYVDLVRRKTGVLFRLRELVTAHGGLRAAGRAHACRCPLRTRAGCAGRTPDGHARRALAGMLEASRS
ncbi:hypothetical protein AB0M80_29935 [Amycolatopsis sp. NPDC051045]|uniref:hypothetical protein n=1 Tax=Amycolatopsis sp. NPDC051045 TaxID=3156922 RepID=UPI003443BD60